MSAITSCTVMVPGQPMHGILSTIPFFLGRSHSFHCIICVIRPLSKQEGQHAPVVAPCAASIKRQQADRFAVGQQALGKHVTELCRATEIDLVAHFASFMSPWTRFRLSASEVPCHVSDDAAQKASSAHTCHIAHCLKQSACMPGSTVPQELGTAHLEAVR